MLPRSIAITGTRPADTIDALIVGLGDTGAIHTVRDNRPAIRKAFIENSPFSPANQWTIGRMERLDAIVDEQDNVGNADAE
jgi:hypothetical protein